MNASEETRHELAALLQTHLEEYAYYSTFWVDKHYPFSALQQMSSFSDRLEWSRTLIQGIIEEIESGGVIREAPGFLVNIVGEPEFNEFANAIAVQMNIMGRIAPLVMHSCSANPTKAREYRDILDEYLREYIMEQLDEFAQVISSPRWFSRRWDVVVDEEIYKQASTLLDEERSSDSTSNAKEARNLTDAEEARTSISTDDLRYLSRRERQVLALLLDGKSNGEISTELGISQNTVKTHVSRVFDKLNVNSRVELLRKLLKG